MKYCSLFFLFLFLFPLKDLFPDEARITGEFEGAAGKEVRLIVIDDYLTYRPVEVAATIIDSGGSFSFSLSLDHAREVELRIDHSRSSFFAEPGVDYHLKYKAFDFSAPQRQDVYWLEEDFEFELSISRGTDMLNADMLLLKELTDDFLAGQSQLLRSNHGNALRAFSQKADSLFSKNQHEFFNQYKAYHFASLFHSLGSLRPRQVLEQYLWNKPIQYENPNYMFLLSRVFHTYIQGGNSPVTFFDMKQGVNTHHSYHFLMETLDKDEVLADERFRELVLLLELSRMFDRRDFIRARVIEVLEQLIRQTPWEEHRQIGRNILWNHTHLAPGHDAPEFRLMHHTGVQHTLDDFRGNYLVLFFFTSWCRSCISDLGVLASMAEVFKDKVSFAGILADRHPETSRELIAANGFPFELYFFEHDYRLLEQYRISDVPRYLVIDPQGKLAVHQLPSPGAGAYEYLMQIINGR